MRKSLTVAMVVVLLLTLAVSSVSAAGSPPPSLSSGFQLQNRSTTLSADVLIEFYDASGAKVHTLPSSIAANASKSFYVPSVLPQPDGRYSIVVNSSEELFALVNQVTSTGASPYVAATHSGFTSAEIGSPLYLPWVVASYYNFNSMFAVQNAGTDPTSITVEFYQSGQSTVKKSYSFNNVAVGASVYLDMTAPPYSTDLAGFFGAVKMYSTGNAQPLAAVLNDTNPTGSFLRSYNAVKSGATQLIAPQVTANYYNFSTGITLQNPGGTAANVTVKFYSAGSTTAVTQWVGTVPAGSAQPIYLPGVAGMPTNFNGSAVVDSDQPLFGIANHDNPTGPAAAYNLIATSDAATTVYMPQIVRAYYGFESGYMLYNIGPEAVQVAVTFTKPDGVVVTTINHTIPAGSAFTYYLGDSRGAALGTGFNGGAKATVTSGNGKLVGIANFVAPNAGDNMQVYNLFK